MDREDFYEQASNRILTIFPQQRYHHNAYIIGGRKGLEDLRRAIDDALAEGADRGTGMAVGLAHAHPGDDEVFTTAVILDCDFDDEENGHGHATGIPIPYYDPNCADELREGAVSLAPNERHVMEVGVQGYLLNQKLKAAEAVVTSEDALKESEGHPS